MFVVQDFYPLLVFLGGLIVLVVITLFVSLLGTREKTYEEAIAEQKRKTQEIALQTKTEKPPKEKKKKHPKKTKDKEKSVESEDDPAESSSNVPSVVEIFEPKVEKVNVAKVKSAGLPKKLNNMENKENIGTKEINVKESYSNLILESKNNEINVKQKREKKDEVKVLPILENKSKTNVLVSKKEEEPKPKSGKNSVKGMKIKNEPDVKVEVAKNIPHEDTPVKEEAPVQKKEKDEGKQKVSKAEESKRDDVQVPTSVVSPKKNKKKELGGGDSLLIGARMVTAIKDAILTDAEMQTLIEILLNRQQEGESWVKPGQKIDPLFVLKKQLQEKEQILADEKQVLQVTQTKLKEARQENTRYVQQERSLREKLNALQQELQNVQMLLHHKLEQRELEINALKGEYQQLQSKFEKDQLLSSQIKDEESEKLKRVVTQMEESKNLAETEITQLQLQVEQWRATAEQLQAQTSDVQQSSNELEQHVCQLQQQLQELDDSKNQDENSYKQQINELITQLTQMEAEKKSLQITLQSSQSESNSLHGKLLNFEKNNTNYSQSMKEMESKFRAVEEKANKYVIELDARDVEISHLVEQLQKEKQAYLLQKEKLTDEVNKKDSLVIQLQEEVNNKSNTFQRLSEDLETQRRKNNDLREKNWKAMEALSSAEKRAEEKLRQADKRMKEAVDDQVEKEQKIIRETMEKIFPNLAVSSNSSFNEWLERFEKEVREMSSNDASSADLLKQLAEAQETESALNAQVQNYQGILAETESILNKLQKSVEAEEETWKKRLFEKEEEVHQLNEDKKILEEEKAALENNLEQIKAAEEMQEKLKELKEKLQVEEKEKRILELRYKEAQTSSKEIHKQLEENNKELELVRNEKIKLDHLRKDLEIDLEKEKKSNKETSAQNVKLNSLVRIGQDSLKAEQDLVIQLQKELSEQKTSATNGSAGPEVSIEVNPSKK